MKRFIVLATVLVALALCAGCGGLNETFVRAVDSNWSVMGPDYKQYLDADEALSERSKLIRLRAIAEFSKLVAEAKAEFEDGDGGAP